MSIKRRFLFASISTILITLFSILIIYSFVSYSSLQEIPSLSQIYRILTTQRSLSEDEIESFELLSTYVNKSPNLLEAPLSEDLIETLNYIETKNLNIAIRKNNDFTYFSDNLREQSLVFHAPEYDLNNFEPSGTLDNNGRFFHYVKSDFKYLDGTKGSFIILKRESNLFEFFVNWGFIVIVLILGIAFVSFTLINRFLDKTVLKPLIALDHDMQSILKDNGSHTLSSMQNFPGAVKEVEDLQKSFKKMYYDLEASQEKQRMYEENRKELIANISHDLKTPMTSIIGYVEGLKDGIAQSDEKREQYLDTIYDKSLLLNELIDQLFLYSKLDLEAKFHFEPINFNKYLKNKITSFQNEGIEVQFNSDVEDVIVDLDLIQFDRVLENIIQNSLKFKKKESHLSLSFNLYKDQMVHLDISDNGVGIAEEDLLHIFDRFYRTDKSRTPTIKGSGLGLSIVKQIIEHHNGSVTVASELGQGTTLSLSLPIRKDEQNEG